MVWKAALVLVALSLSSATAADSTTTCRPFVGTMRCTTTDDLAAPSVADNIAAGQAIGSALSAIFQRKPRPVANVAPPPKIDLPAAMRGIPLTPDNGNQYYETCKNGGGALAGVCFGYLQGFITRERVLAPYGSICFPQDGNFGQMLDILIAFLRDHPADRSRELGLLTAAAFYQVFPCQSAAPTPTK